MKRSLLWGMALLLLTVASFRAGVAHAQSTVQINTVLADWTLALNSGNLAKLTITGVQGGQSGSIALDLVAKTCTAAGTTYCGGAASSTMSQAQVSALGALLPAAAKQSLVQQVLDIIQAVQVQ